MKKIKESFCICFSRFLSRGFSGASSLHAWRVRVGYGAAAAGGRRASLESARSCYDGSVRTIGGEVRLPAFWRTFFSFRFQRRPKRSSQTARPPHHFCIHFCLPRSFDKFYWYFENRRNFFVGPLPKPSVKFTADKNLAAVREYATFSGRTVDAESRRPKW